MHHEAKGCIRLEETAWIKATMEQSHRKLCGRNQWTRMTLPEAVNFYFLRYTEQQQRRKNEWWEQSEYTFVVSKRLRSRHKHAAARLHSCRLAALFVSPLWFSLLCGRVWIRGDGGDQLVAICCHFVSWTRGGASAGQKPRYSKTCEPESAAPAYWKHRRGTEGQGRTSYWWEDDRGVLSVSRCSSKSIPIEVPGHKIATRQFSFLCFHKRMSKWANRWYIV